MIPVTPEEELIRAERARQILAEPLVANALEAIRASIIDAWRASPVTATDLRDYLHAMYNAAHKFEELLRSHIETGTLAAEQLRQKGTQDGTSRRNPYT